MGEYDMSRQDESKPRIVLLRKWDDGVYYKCSDKKLEAYGSTPEEAFEMWKIISGVKEWKAQGHLIHTSGEQVSMGTHRHEEVRPFSLLKYVETPYSNSSVPLS